MPLQSQFPTALFNHNGGLTSSLLTQFTPSLKDAGVFQDTFRYLALHIADGRYACWKLGSATGGLSGFEERYAVINIDEDDGIVTRGGGGWVNNNGSSNSYGGDYSRTNTIGAYAQWTTPTGVTEVGLYGLASVGNAGMALVSIDGDPTLANYLPTAQDLVTAGVLASTALVANGGTLNPTDRILDQHGETATYGGRMLAIGLIASAHTIRVTVTGYKRAAATDTRLYFSGVFYGGRSVATMSTAGVSMFRTAVITEIASRHEYALSFRPTGAAGYDFIGHSNTTVGVYADVIIDGVSTTLTNGQVKGCISQAAIVASAVHTHPQTGSTQVAHGVTTWIIQPEYGLTIDWSLIWDVDGNMGTAYPAMFPLGSYFTSGSNARASTDVSLTANTGVGLVNFKSQAAYLWGQNWGALLFLPDLSNGVNNYIDCVSSFLYIEDRIGGDVNKIYALRSDSSITITAGMVWTSKANYRAMYFANAGAVLAR